MQNGVAGSCGNVNSDSAYIVAVKVSFPYHDSKRDAAEVWFWRRKGLSGTINVLAQALYSLFGADGEPMSYLVRV